MLTLFNILSVAYRVIKIGPANLFNKSSITEEISYGSNGSLALLVSHVLVALSCMTALYSVSAARKDDSYKKYAIINVICLLISYFPTNLSRYATAAVYGSLLLVSIPKLKKSRLFIVGFTLAFLVIFPFLNNYKNSDIANVDFIDSVTQSIKSIPTCWTEVNYDSYTTYTLTLDEVRKNGTTNGYQLLGALLFFVPRSIWSNKPIGSGDFMAKKLGTFTNISCSFPGEGYVNFGVVGIVLFGLLMGFFMNYLDNVYWENEKRNSIRISTLYPVLLMMLFFILRGDLMSSYAYTFAFVFTWFIVDRICLPQVSEDN